MGLFEETERSVAAATADGSLDPVVSAGPVAALLGLARRIDVWDELAELALEQAEVDGSRARVPANDNTSIPTYLKFCESLRLTPASRVGLVREASGGKLDELKKAREQRRRA